MIDMQELRKVIDECDVFAVGFRTFPQRVIVDARASGEEGPMMEIVEPVSTVEERFFWLGKRRPAFESPERFTFFVWPHSVRYLAESGILDRIRQRVALPEYPHSAQAVDTVVTQLETLEKQATLDAIQGTNYHTLWEQTVE